MRCAAGAAALVVLTGHLAPAHAKGGNAVVLPAVTPIADGDECPPHRLGPEAERQLSALSRELDNTVVEAAQDLGLTIDLPANGALPATRPTEAALLEQARTNWVFSPRLDLSGNRVVVRILAVAPHSSVVLSRTEEMKPSEIEVRSVLMMRDLVSAAGAPAAAIPTPQANEGAVVQAARSRGRAVLALNAAAFGGYIGFSLQRAGGSDDARLTYPLIALGTGLGLGASMIVAEEWDVGVGDAWYLSAGTWWPLFGTLLIAKDEPERRRFLYGAGASVGGLALATTSLAFGGVTEGDALLAHSGGAFGTILGGVADLIVKGGTSETPTTGMGIGAISGVVLTGALARFAPPQPASRILLVDLSAGLGALTGAAVASPLIFGEDVGTTRNRLWLSSIALGTFIGGAVGLVSTAGTALGQDARDAAWMTRVSPYVGVVAEVPNRSGTSSPVTGAGLRGVW